MEESKGADVWYLRPELRGTVQKLEMDPLVLIRGCKCDSGCVKTTERIY